MHAVTTQLILLFPALAFLLVGVPLAVLLEKLGFFRAAADILLHRNPSLLKLWLLAAVTTAVLNLDTTIVLLTPLYAHIARKSKIPALPLLLIPLLLACFASAALPVSNLTNLIAVSTLHLSVIDFLSHLALPSIVSVTLGWVLYRRLFPNKLQIIPLDKAPDKRALSIGSGIILFLLVGFTLGSVIGIDAWVIALIADIALMLITRFAPWHSVPLKTALQVAGIAALAVLAIQHIRIGFLFEPTAKIDSMVLATALATLGANTVNNLPTTLVGMTAAHEASWGVWAWLVGVNFGAVLLPIGALANILWRNIAQEQGVTLTLRQYVAITLPIGLPVLGAAFLTLIMQRLLWG